MCAGLGLANPSWQPLPGGRCGPGSPALGALSCPQAPRRALPWCPPSSLDQEGVARAALVQVTPPRGCGRSGARMHAPEWLEAKFTTALLGGCTPTRPPSCYNPAQDSGHGADAQWGPGC